jgi:CheY-like chemotaxis protein
MQFVLRTAGKSNQCDCSKGVPELRILVIDDEEMIRNLAEKILVKGGFDVVSVASGEEAVELVDKDGSFDALLLDYTLPGMTGVETLAEIRKSHPDIPCILSSGQPLDNSCLSPGLESRTSFLEKPYRANILIEAVKARLG